MTKHEKVIALLRQTADEVQAILNEPVDEMHQLRIIRNLSLEAERMELLGGFRSGGVERPAKLQPATTIGGKIIHRLGDIAANNLIPNVEEMDKFKEDVENAWESFLEREPDELLQNVPDRVLRGVAKRAKFNWVTPEKPKVFTIEHVNRIKEAIDGIVKDAESLASTS